MKNYLSQSQRHQLFHEAVEAYLCWENGAPEPKVSIETWENGEPKNREFSISEVCGLLWNCKDKMPFWLIEQLDRDIEYDKEHLPITYAAAARRLKRAIDLFKGVSIGKR